MFDNKVNSKSVYYPMVFSVRIVFTTEYYRKGNVINGTTKSSSSDCLTMAIEYAWWIGKVAIWGWHSVQWKGNPYDGFNFNSLSLSCT